VTTAIACARCGNPLGSDRRTREGFVYHRKCYYQVFLWRQCSECGATVSARGDDEHPLCRVCLAKGKSCEKCGDALEIVARITETGYWCPTCAGKPKSEVQCESCFGMKKQLAGRDAEGRAVCGRCLRESKKEGWECPQCKRTDVPYHSNRMCRYCFLIRRARREVKRIAAAFKTEKVRMLFSEYTEAEIKRLEGRTDLAKRFTKQQMFFAVLDETLAESQSLPLSFLRARFGGDLWTKFRLPMDFIIGAGMVDGYEGPVALEQGESDLRQCSACGEPTRRIGIYWGEEAYCYKCRGELFEQIPCGQCGADVYTMNGEGPAICKYCRAKGQDCAYCGRPLEYVERIGPDGYACRVCTKSLEPKVKCAVCGHEKTWVTYRDEQGRRVCAACNNAGHEGHRPSSLTDNAHKDHVLESCQVCAEAEKALVILAETLQENGWKDHFVAFGRWLTAKSGPRYSNKILPVHLIFFARLGCLGDTPGEMTIERLLKICTPKELFSHRVPLRYLTENKVILSANAKETEITYERAVQVDKQRRILERSATRWYGELVNGYHNFLTDLADESVIEPHTATGYLRSAERFLRDLESQGVASVQEIDKDHYLDIESEHKRVPLRRFLQYLREYVPECEMIYPETMPYRRATFDLVLENRNRLDLLKMFLAPPDDLLRVSLLGLLMLLCFQSPGRVVLLRRDDLARGKDGRYTFGKKQIPLGEKISKVVERYLSTLDPTGRAGSESDYLFPGPSITGHIDSITVHREFRKLEIKAGKLCSTAIARYFMRCNTEGIYLTEAYGVPPGTVRWYRDTFLQQAASTGITHRTIFNEE